jgi:hypothetical protein
MTTAPSTTARAAGGACDLQAGARSQGHGGEKTVTRRLCSENPRSPWWRERCGYVEGQVFTINPGRGVPNIGRARVVSVRKERFGEAFGRRRAEWLREGFESPAAMRRAFEQINGRIRGNRSVWRIEFEVCS